MKLKAWIPLLLAIALGVVAAIMAKSMFSNRGTNTIVINTVPVMVARKNLAAGQELTPADMMVSQVEAKEAPEPHFSSPGELTGRVLDHDVAQGVALNESQLAPQGSGRGLQAMVPAGMRAISVEVNEFSGVAGLLQPGARVDVLATIQQQGDITTRTIVQNVKVTAVGQRLSANAQRGEDVQQSARSVTLIATPEQAEQIELAATICHPRLVLRSLQDGEETDSSGVTLAELRGVQPVKSDPFVNEAPVKPVSFGPTTKPVPTIVETPRFRQVTTIRGGQESKVQFKVKSAPGDQLMTDTSIERN